MGSDGGLLDARVNQDAGVVDASEIDSGASDVLDACVPLGLRSVLCLGGVWAALACAACSEDTSSLCASATSIELGPLQPWGPACCGPDCHAQRLETDAEPLAVADGGVWLGRGAAVGFADEAGARFARSCGARETTSTVLELAGHRWRAQSCGNVVALLSGVACMERRTIEGEQELSDIVLLAGSPDAAEPDLVVRGSSGALIHLRPDGATKILESRSRRVFPSGTSRILFSTEENPTQPSRAWMAEMIEAELSVSLLRDCDGALALTPVDGMRNLLVTWCSADQRLRGLDLGGGATDVPPDWPLPATLTPALSAARSGEGALEVIATWSQSLARLHGPVSGTPERKVVATDGVLRSPTLVRRGEELELWATAYAGGILRTPLEALGELGSRQWLLPGPPIGISHWQEPPLFITLAEPAGTAVFTAPPTGEVEVRSGRVETIASLVGVFSAGGPEQLLGLEDGRLVLHGDGAPDRAFPLAGYANALTGWTEDGFANVVVFGGRIAPVVARFDLSGGDPTFERLGSAAATAVRVAAPNGSNPRIFVASQPARLTEWRREDDGTWTSGRTRAWDAFEELRGMAIDDLDGDGHLDAVIALSGAVGRSFGSADAFSAVEWVRVPADALLAFDRPESPRDGPNESRLAVRDVEIADLDADERPDVVLAFGLPGREDTSSGPIRRVWLFPRGAPWDGGLEVAVPLVSGPDIVEMERIGQRLFAASGSQQVIEELRMPVLCP